VKQNYGNYCAEQIVSCLDFARILR